MRYATLGIQKIAPRRKLPPLRVEVSVKVRVSFRVGRQPDIIVPKKIAPWLGLRFGLGLVLGLGGNFP